MFFSVNRERTSVFVQFLLEEKMEAIRQKLKEADNIPGVIDLILNLRIPNKGCKNIEDMKERMLTHLSSRTEVGEVKLSQTFKMHNDRFKKFSELIFKPNLIKTLATGAISKLTIQTREPIPT
ncbi:uncharacterized protein [Pocillopora verrucosa]|uniref:uncharacterized protein n=1 Tax=Pocillopora verrucosa TaxID=203993 RepID=UPI003342720D